MKNSLIFLILFSLISCVKDNTKNIEDNVFEFIENINYQDGFFPHDCVNLVDINSEYDDYNSDWPDNLEWQNFDIVFSSNRNSMGEDFDFIGFPMGILYDTNKDSLNISIDAGHSIDYLIFKSSFDLINTQYDELGPYQMKYGDEYASFLMFYSNNETGNQDIKFVYNEVFVDSENSYLYTDSIRLLEAQLLNSDSNESYISFDSTNLYFCSDKEGDYDIFSVEIPDNQLIDWLQLPFGEVPILKIKTLSSKGDDKCPFVNGNLMVFASNDVSGYGGYDLWYSIKKNGIWGTPKNFGERINTEFDEYRPVTSLVNDSKNDIMVFSSNRPNGKGGFDLYYTGISKMIK